MIAHILEPSRPQPIPVGRVIEIDPRRRQMKKEPAPVRFSDNRCQRQKVAKCLRYIDQRRALEGNTTLRIADHPGIADFSQPNFDLISGLEETQA